MGPLLQAPAQQIGGPNVQLPTGHHLPMDSPLVHPPPMPNGPGYTPEHQHYLAHRNYRAKVAYTAYRALIGSVEGRLVEGRGMKDMLIRVSTPFMRMQRTQQQHSPMYGRKHE